VQERGPDEQGSNSGTQYVIRSVRVLSAAADAAERAMVERQNAAQRIANRLDDA